MIDPVLVTRKINLISQDLRSLVRYKQMTLAVYLHDPIHEVAVERYLERIIGRMIDINYHLIVESGDPPPKDYYESFTELGKMNILPPAFSKKIARAAGLRNRIAHEYEDIDEKKIHASLRVIIKDIPKYLEHINKFCRRKRG